MKARGHDVTGSDKSDSDLIHDLQSQGITVTLKQDGSGLVGDFDLFVYSEAIPETSPERLAAGKKSIRQISYFAALGELSADTDFIAICGTHGKSSTTAMAATVFAAAGKDPNVVVGTKVPSLGGRNWRKGEGSLWIVEACEYRRSFLHLSPKTIIITNADGDHFDAFRNADEYRQAFVAFLKKLTPDGTVIAHGSDKESVAIIKEAGRTFIDAEAEALPELSVPGVHMQKNAQLVLALAKTRGLDEKATRKELKNFGGTWRRMEVKGTTPDGVTVIDDYAHHPTEIKATIAAIKAAYPDRPLVCVFEPHTNDRTLKLWKEFTASFTDADLVLVTKVYDARPDKDKQPADVAKFAAEIGRTSKVSCRPTGTIERTKTTLREVLESGDVLLVMGAGDSTKLAAAMVA